MQLKIITRNEVFRFNQNGQPVAEITEPYVNVEVYTREDVLALYDQNEEHLVHAFKYNDDEIAGLSDQATDSIQNFFLAEGAWYLQALNQPEDDRKRPADIGTNDKQAANITAASIPPDNAVPSTPVNLGTSVFVPTEQQRNLLREIQVTVKALSIIKPDPAAAWDRQVQKLLLSQQLFGIDDPERASKEAEAKLTQLVAQAKAAAVPENILEANMEPADDALAEDEDEGEPEGEDEP